MKEINVKTTTKFLTMLAALLISFSVYSREELATVIGSKAIYDESNITVECDYDINYGKVCERVARPDRPFPLPIAFTVTVQTADGETATLPAPNLYRKGVKIMVIRD